MAVIGLGTMGAGIAEVFARKGLPVTAVEVNQETLGAGMAALDRSLARASSRGRLTEAGRAQIAARIRPASALADTADADLVIEVVPEQLAIKRQVLAELDQACRPDAIIATNTSSLSVTAIAAGSAHPDRVIGMHFFNPAPVMRLVEVVTTVLTRPAVTRAVLALARDLGKTPVQVSDRAGFIANALLLPYLNHAARLAETGYASLEDIDAAMTGGAGLPMGPLALLDLIGLDTSLAILEILRAAFGGSRYVPAPLLRRLAEAGRTGRKSGAGFYDYPASPAAPAADFGDIDNEDRSAPAGTVTLIDPRPAGGAGERPGALPIGQAGCVDPAAGRAADLAGLITAAGVAVSRDPAGPAGLTVVAVGPQGGVLDAALAAGRAPDAVGLHLSGLAAPAADRKTAGAGGTATAGAGATAGRVPGVPVFAELVATRLTSASALAAALALAGRLDLRVVRAPDRPGLLVGALLCPHLRDAVAMVADGYATPDDIDTAMTLGCGYSRGPIELLERVGYRQVLGVLQAMYRQYGDPAFAPPPLLAELAAAGQPLPVR